MTAAQPEFDPYDFSWTNFKRLGKGPTLPLPPGETIKAVMKKHPLVKRQISEKVLERRERYAAEAAAEAAEAAEAEAAAVPKAPTKAPPTKPIHATAFQLRDPASLPEREWLHGRHYIRKYATASVGSGGGGKTAHSISEALAMATGRPLLDPDGPLTKPLRVWWINAEDPQDEIDRRFHAAAKHFKVTEGQLEGRLFTDSGRDQEFVIARTEGRDLKIAEPFVASMVAEIKRREIDVVVVDPFVSTHEAPENDNSAMQRVTAAWVRIADEANCGVELVHHVAKNQGEVTADSARGGGAFKDKVRSMRVFNAMTATEAEKSGVDDPRAYFRLDFGKVNMVASGRSQWRRFVSVPLGNGGAFSVGDEIGVVEPWRWPSLDVLAEQQAEARMAVVAEVPEDTLAGLKVRLGAAAYKADPKGKPWAGDVVMELTGVANRKEAKAMLDAWVEMGELDVVEEYDASARKTRNFVKPTSAPR
ncbi:MULTISPECIES: AAA family ATPase [unclassified Mesorhizobium]|uniref:AAA family ATPase n=1 Tax=unclassified Mesorhizobium TaxID=325217 RepID=UPI0011264162|nr:MULTISPECIES: AAA family ATPase [unclassified Mesorhizobium]TPJ38162.1 recombinase RecA [Mesorhizobium sp. B2-6-6]MCA0000932.1 helicase RepA family protein [Mesorhizobium sp. B264B2A]MCA0004681.1 helicase RepA family protein [Mesorhizobium sp. B264B1B]MCA0019120.1 helicase RepA family protein [Mesorhizobium sp. B264B1A]TPJ54972.1 recombinase RecA [Mesorhizobium sp. B2-6-7]